MGFLNEAWVFVNDKPVLAKENIYYPVEARLDPPEGRISLDNASFDLPLQQGDNEVMIGLNNILGVGHKHWGWGLELRLNDVQGLVLGKGS